ncbi:MAG: YidC/Oxa1 family membrane protein insertase [Phycisphaerales bacterium]
MLISTVHFQSINIIPLLMAVVFYFQQKLTTPPAANEQQAQQQKMMKFMIFLFPVFLYFAPSGLNLYIMASTTAGIVDSYIVRKHIKEEASGGCSSPSPSSPAACATASPKPSKPSSSRSPSNKSRIETHASGNESAHTPDP